MTLYLAPTLFVLSILMSCFSYWASAAEIPERFRLSPGYTVFDTSDVVFKSNFALVFKYGDYGQGREVALNGKLIFGQDRPMEKERFVSLLTSSGDGPFSNLSYENYVQQWLVEKVAPHYFRTVLNLASNNFQIKKSLVNHLSLKVHRKMEESFDRAYSLDTIKMIREFIKKSPTITVPVSERNLLSSGFTQDDFGKLRFPLPLNFYDLYTMAKNQSIDDQIFYERFSKELDEQIMAYVSSSKRWRVLFQALEKEMQSDPMLMITNRIGDEDVIYQYLTQGDRNSLKQMNYLAEGKKITFKAKKDIELVLKYLKEKSYLVSAKELLNFIEKNTGVTIRSKNLLKFSENTTDNEVSSDSYLWSPIRLLKGEVAFENLQADPFTWFVAEEVSSSGLYQYPIESDYAQKMIYDELQNRKQKILYRRVVDRLSNKYPLKIQVGHCLDEKPFCFQDDFWYQIKQALVKKSETGQSQEYLEFLDSSLFESSI